MTDTKKKLKESITTKEKLYEFITKFPNATGVEAFEYLVSKGVSNESAIETIKQYGYSKEEVAGPSTDTTPTIQQDVMPDHKDEVNKVLNVYKGGTSSENTMTKDSKDVEDIFEDKKEETSEAGASGVVPNSPNCPEGQIWNSTERKCMPTSTGYKTTAPSEASKATHEGRQSINADIASEKKRVAEYYKKLDKLEALRNLKVADARIAAKERYLKEKRLDSLIRNAKEVAIPRAGIVPTSAVKAGEAATQKVSANEAEISGPVAWMKDVASEKNVTPSYVWHVNKQRIFENSSQRFLKEFDANDNVKYAPIPSEVAKATEAVTGPASNDFMRTMSEQVLVLPNGKVVTPIRQFCETKVLSPGVKEAFFYDFGSVNFSDVTEDGSTQVGESSVVIRSSGGAASPRGTKLTIGYTQLEESPIDIVSAANRSYALESVNDESVEVLQRAFNDDVGSSGDASNRKDKGGGVKTGRWVNNAGTQITSDASGLGNLTFAGLVAAKGVIEDEGLDPSNLVTYTTGKAIRDLIFDPDLDTYISFSRPAIITEATVERIAGTNVVRSSAPAAGSQSGSKRSVMFVPNIAFGLITGRDLTLEAQRRNELQVVFLTGTQRIAGFVKNVEATCRISHL